MPSTVKKLLKNIVNSLGYDLRIFHSAQEIQNQTSRIGSYGAAEVFEKYILCNADLCHDKLLVDFMRFYAENWNFSSSQWSQDIFVLYALNSKTGGRYLEIGGGDGFTHSNTYSLEKNYAWSGTLVEPDPHQFMTLKKARVGNSLIQAAMSPIASKGYHKMRQIGQLSTLEGYEHSDMHKHLRMASQAFINVKSIPLSDLLRTVKYDYFSLDVEGSEFDILNSMDWTSICKPTVLTVEHNFRKSDRDQISKLLEAQGYIEFFKEYDWLRRGDIWAVHLSYIHQ